MPTVTHATATVQYGRHDQDDHVIHVTTYHGPDDEEGTPEEISVNDAAWESAFGRTAPERIEHILGWAGLQTEHNQEYCHVIFK